MTWNRVPKNVFVGLDVLQLGVYDAVPDFNIGAEAAVKIFDEVKEKGYSERRERYFVQSNRITF